MKNNYHKSAPSQVWAFHHPWAHLTRKRVMGAAICDKRVKDHHQYRHGIAKKKKSRYTHQRIPHEILVFFFFFFFNGMRYEIAAMFDVIEFMAINNGITRTICCADPVLQKTVVPSTRKILHNFPVRKHGE